ncbi:MAG: SIS domain-containing protein, partial [Actinobacteria bacterium]|nr:SIS domain-containing protein [Actinomycetota bacterium]
VLVVGQGTAAVAAQGIAHVIGTIVGKRLAVTPQLATEFSAWRLRRDMSDTVVVAVSQSGSTTDTNRAVDLARERGAAVIAIVNRRESDLAHKSDGVVYTSDGRDVELSVASTKAFYSQIAAGSLLGLAFGRVLDVLDPELETSLISSLVALPDQLAALLGDPSTVHDVARAVATRYPNWAVVGSGPNRVSANEVRIKLSELCYRTVAVDAVEDKKHIDLSAESLVLVCAAGAPPNQLHDLAKEVEIFKAHSNQAVVICDADTVGMWSTDLVIPIPSAHPAFAWVLGTAAGHLFSYHAAQAIDATAQPLRRALEELEHLVDSGATIGRTPPAAVVHPIDQVLTSAADGELRGVLSSSATMGLVRIVAGTQLGAAAGAAVTSGVDDVRVGLGVAIEELTLSIDTIKHQAKTVTVGTSRSDADLYDNLLVEAMRSAGADVLTLNLPVLDVLRSLAPMVRSAEGVTRYALDWSRPEAPRLAVVGKFGSSAGLTSRADDGAPLSGSKRRVAELALPRLVLGRGDSRIVVIVPE